MSSTRERMGFFKILWSIPLAYFLVKSSPAKSGMISFLALLEV